jgi:hypothetical protein
MGNQHWLGLSLVGLGSLMGVNGWGASPSRSKIYFVLSDGRFAFLAENKL